MVIYLRGDAEDNLCIWGPWSFKKDQTKEHSPINYPERLSKSYKYVSWSIALLIFYSSHLFLLKVEKVHDFLNNFTCPWNMAAIKIQDSADVLIARVYATSRNAGWMSYSLYEQQTLSCTKKYPPKSVKYLLPEMKTAFLRRRLCHSFDIKPCYSTWLLRILSCAISRTPKSFIRSTHTVGIPAVIRFPVVMREFRCSICKRT